MLREPLVCTPTAPGGPLPSPPTLAACSTTLPASPRDLIGAADQRALMISAMGFLDGVSKVSSMASLSTWLTWDVVANGWGPAWPVIREAGCPVVTNDPVARDPEARMLIQMARRHVLAALRSLRDRPDDSWIMALIERGCLQRRADSRGWVPWVTSDRNLSELVLALFAAAWIGDSAGMARKLCLCDECDGVSFNPAATGAHGCPTHPDLRTARGTLLRPW